jgi:ribosomal protein S18 acetylase RimI-like enzyme
VPAQRATTDGRLRRALAFERDAYQQAAARVEPLPYGLALVDERRPEAYNANVLWVTARDGVGAGDLVADAGALLGGCTQPKVVVEHEALARALTPELRSAGWTAEWTLYMTHERAPDRCVDLAAVREVRHDDLLAAEDRHRRDQPRTKAAAARRQVIAHKRAVGELLDERCFAAYAGGEICAYAKLRHRDRVAQVEDVVVLPGHRGAGLGRVVTSAALAAGLALEPELLFIGADDDDWPKELYARLGFVAVGRAGGFLRPPPSGAGAAVAG